MDFFALNNFNLTVMFNSSLYLCCMHSNQMKVATFRSFYETNISHEIAFLCNRTISMNTFIALFVIPSLFRFASLKICTHIVMASSK